MPASVDLNGLVLRSNGRKSSAPDFPLRAGYFTPAKMPLNLIYPRPDGETPAHARHRNFHSQMTYEIPIGIQGGAWPFKYEILSAPAGATIGQYYGTTNYGVISWTPSGQTGSQSFSVRVTDCDGSTIVIDWTATLNDSAFVFVNPNAVTSGSGSISSPLKLWSDWYLNDHNNTAYANKIIVLRGGTHVLYGASGATAGVFNVQVDTNIKPTSFVEFPGESAVIDCSQGKMVIQNANDFYVSGGLYDYACQLVNNAHVFWMVGENNSRATFFDVGFDHFDEGLVGDDNANAIFLGGSAGVRNYFLVKNCTFENFAVYQNGGFIDLYDVSNFLIEGCVCSNSFVSLGMHAKATVAFGTMRNNDFYENISGCCMAIGYSSAANLLPHDHEVCWNRMKNSGAVEIFRCVASTGYPGQTYNTFVYRNTFYGVCPWIRFVGAEPFDIDANLVVSTTTLTNWDMSIATVTYPNTATTTLTAVDANLLPTDATLRYRRGCEVYA
jgi:hypothetical protein